MNDKNTSTDSASATGATASSRSPWLWIALIAVALALFWAWRHYDLGQWLTLDRLKTSRESLLQLYQAKPLATLGTFFAVYVAVAALSLPGAAILTLAAGAMFGFWTGLLLASFASSIGALLAFLAARYVLRDAVQSRFGQKLAPINDGFKRGGAWYLLTLRLLPVFPFFLVNLLVALTPIKAGTFYIVSQLGMLLGTAVFVNAGTQLASINKLGDVLSPSLLLSFALLGIVPLITKAVVGWFQRRKAFAAWTRPKAFDRNIVVIGAGSGGLISALIASVVKAKVTLVEEHKMGGDCLNFGCVPSKALIRSARLSHQIRHADKLGIRDAKGTVDFAAVMQRVHNVIKTIAPHDSVERFTGMGVDVVQGRATIKTPWSVEIARHDGTKQLLTTKNIIVATGAAPFVPPIPGLKDVGCLTSDTLWDLKELPRRLCVLGGGPIGCELSQAFARLGSQVTMVEMAPRIMVREDEDAAAVVAQSLRDDGVTILASHKAVRFETSPTKRLIAEAGGKEVVIEFDALLCAVGRAARVKGFGLEELGVRLTERKTIETDAWLRTSMPNIYAVGDVASPYQFTHAAAHEAWYAAVNSLFGRFKTYKADYRFLPWVTFTEPEVARVGLSEMQAKQQGTPYEVTRYGIDDLDRAIADDVAHGFIKVLTVPGKDTILGVTIVGDHAGEILPEYVFAMKHGMGLNKIMGTIHAYPTMAETNKFAASEWKKKRAPQGLLQWVKRYHDWERA
jgi:dihydrolipoamide dehydrogenase